MNSVIRQLYRSEPHTSVSAINTYRRCPASYRFKYVEGAVPETRAANLVMGIALHEALARFYNALKDSTLEPSADELHHTFCDKFEQVLHDEDAPPVLFSEKESPESCIEMARALLGAFLTNAQRPYCVVGVEEPFSVELFPGCRFAGVIDCIVQDADGTYRILEHKSAARRWPADRIANDLQVSLYAAVAPLIGLQNADNRIAVDIQLLLKQKAPTFAAIRVLRSRRDIDEAVEIAAGVMQAVRAGIFYVNRDWQCQSCPYASLCLCGESEVAS